MYRTVSVLFFICLGSLSFHAAWAAGNLLFHTDNHHISGVIYQPNGEPAGFITVELGTAYQNPTGSTSPQNRIRPLPGWSGFPRLTAYMGTRISSWKITLNIREYVLG